MAQLAGIIETSHGPFTNLEPENWDSQGSSRTYREDVPKETMEEKVAKAARLRAAIEVLGNKLDEMRPDALIVFGDELPTKDFDPRSVPAAAVLEGESFVGHRCWAPGGRGKPEDLVTVPGHPALGSALLTGLRQRGFPSAATMVPPTADHAMDHSIMRPLEFFQRFSTPTVPVLLNGYFAPQGSAMHNYQVGRAAREIIDAYPEDLRVAVIGSGGLWHTPMAPDSWLNEEFDTTELEYLARGDIKGMAEYFDNYKVPEGDSSQDIDLLDKTPIYGGLAALPRLSGPQAGTRETCNWITAAAVADGRPTVIVDYVPVYASPIGTAFAYCDDL